MDIVKLDCDPRRRVTFFRVNGVDVEVDDVLLKRCRNPAEHAALLRQMARDGTAGCQETLRRVRKDLAADWVKRVENMNWSCPPIGPRTDWATPVRSSAIEYTMYEPIRWKRMIVVGGLISAAMVAAY